MAVLEEIQAKGAVMLATTHYSEIKEFAEKTQALEMAAWNLILIPKTFI